MNKKQGQHAHAADSRDLKVRGAAPSATEALNRRISELEAINARLEKNLAESHHRVKNSLQNVLSLLNLQSRKQGVLSARELKKFSAHVHGLAALHDVLYSDSREGGDMRSLQIDRVFERILSVLMRGVQKKYDIAFEACAIPSRQAATLAVVLIEFVSDALEYGEAPISIELSNQGKTGLLSVLNDRGSFGSAGAPKVTDGGLGLAMALCAADLGAEPQFSSNDQTASRRLSFPLYTPEPA